MFLQFKYLREDWQPYYYSTFCYEIFELFWSLKGRGEGGVGWGPNAKFGQ